MLLACPLSIVIGPEWQRLRISAFAPTATVLAVPRCTDLSVPGASPQSRRRVHCAHLSALRLLLAHPIAPCAFVFEEDVVPAAANGTARLASLEVPRDWEYLNLGRCFARCDRQVVVRPRIVRDDHSLCRHAYALTRAAAARIANTTARLDEPGDIRWRRLFADRGVRAYATTPRLYVQDRRRFKSQNGRTDDARECARRATPRKPAPRTRATRAR